MESSYRYDKSVAEISPKGRIYQLEYSDIASIKEGNTCIAIKGSGYICIVIEKSFNLQGGDLIDNHPKFIEYSKNMGFLCSGNSVDQKILSNEIVQIIGDYNNRFSSQISIQELSLKIGQKLQFNSQFASKRINAVKVLLFGVTEEKGPEIWKCETSGLLSFSSFCSIGKKERELNSHYAAKLKKKRIPLMDQRQIIIEPIRILQSTSKDDLKAENLVIYLSGKENNGFRKLSDNEVKNYVSQLDG